MLVDQLSAMPAYDIATAVLSVLAGGTVPQIAAHVGISAQELDEAIRVYQAAGYHALERRAEREWYQVRVQFPQWTAAEDIAARELQPRLDQLQDSGAVTGWWFLRKHPCWRLRIRAADPGDPAAAVDPVLNELLNAGLIDRWWTTTYEPEIAAFGGGLGMNAAHDLFCADSRGVLDYSMRTAPGLGRRELSILLFSAMMRAAGLDWFECGDVFDRVTRLRPPPTAADAAQIGKLAVSVRTLLSVPTHQDTTLFAAGGPVEYAQPWLAAFERAGRVLGDAAARGGLERGVRAVFTHILIFHWNRLGLSATTQSVLARAAALAILPRS
jgi:thiopeptide-type bacteriocin biosynthesis protein